RPLGLARDALGLAAPAPLGPQRRRVARTGGAAVAVPTAPQSGLGRAAVAAACREPLPGAAGHAARRRGPFRAAVVPEDGPQPGRFRLAPGIPRHRRAIPTPGPERGRPD